MNSGVCYMCKKTKSPDALIALFGDEDKLCEPCCSHMGFLTALLALEKSIEVEEGLPPCAARSKALGIMDKIPAKRRIRDKCFHRTLDALEHSLRAKEGLSSPEAQLKALGVMNMMRAFLQGRAKR